MRDLSSLDHSKREIEIIEFPLNNNAVGPLDFHRLASAKDKSLETSMSSIIVMQHKKSCIMAVANQIVREFIARMGSWEVDKSLGG